MIRTIRTRLFISFFAAFLVVLVLLSAILLYGLPGHPQYGGLPRERQQTITSLTIEADSRQDRVLRWLDERWGDIRVNSRSAPVADDVIELHRALGALGRTAPPESPGWQRVQATPPYRRLSGLLHTLAQTYSDYHALALVDGQSGRVIVANRPALLGADLRDDPAFQQAVRTRADATTPIHQSRLLHQPVVSFSGPVRDETGQVIAVLVGECPLDHIASSVFTAGAELGRSGESFLVNSDGTNLHRLKFPVTGKGAPPAPLTYRINTPQVKLALSGKNGVMEGKDYRGAPVLVAYRYIPVTPRWGWAMIVKQDLSESYAAVRARVLFTVALALFGLVAFAALAWFAARRVSAPLLSLTRTAREVSNGDLAARSSVGTRDEIGTLASTFNSLVAGVQERQESLERERRRMELLAGTAAQLLATDDPVAQVNELARHAMEFLDCQVFFNFLADEPVGRLHLNAYAGIPEQAAAEIEWLDYGVAVCGCVAQEGCRIVAEHIPTTPDPRTELVKSFGVRAYACHPILSGEQVLGTLSFGTTTRETFTEDELALMKAVTDQVAIAVVRQRTAEALQRSEEQLRVATQAAGTGVWSWIPGTSHVNVSANWRGLFGIAPDAEVTFETWAEALHPGDRERAVRELNAAAEQHREFDVEYRVVRPDGSMRWVVDRGRAWYDEAGQPVGMAGVNVDVTERKQAEQALRESEGRYRSLFETLLEGFCVIEVLFDEGERPVDYRFLEINPAFEAQTGLHDAQGKRMRELAPDHEAHWFEIYGKVALTGEPVRFVNEARALGRWYDVHAYRVGGPESRRVAILFNDITIRHQAQEALQRSEEQFRTLADSIPTLAWWANGDGYITWYNRRWYEYTGTTPEQMEGWGWQRVHDPEVLPAVLERWQASLATGEPFEMTFPLRGADGVFRDFLTRVYPLKDAQGRVVRWFGTNTDVSALKRAEESLRRQAALIDLSPDGVVVRRMDGTITFWSRGAEAMYGWPREEAIGATTHALLETEYPQPLAEIEQQLQTTGRWTGELQHCTKEGRQIVVQSWWLAEFGSQGQISEILETNVDITERKRAAEILEQQVRERTRDLAEANEALTQEVAERQRAQEAVQAERQRFNEVLETLPVYVVLLTSDYHVAFANRFFRERFGEDKGRRCYEYLFNRTEPCEDCQTYTVRGTKAPHYWQWEGPDGRTYDISDFPFTDTDGTELILEVGLDVTEQRQAQAELRASSLYARSLLEASLDPLVTISAEGKITDVNAAASAATGRPREELIATDFSDYFTEPEEARRGYQQVFSRGYVTDYPLTIRHRDGRLMHVLYNAAVYRDEEGNVRGVFAAARDVTAQRQAEAALRESHNLQQAVLNGTTDAVFVKDLQGRYLLVNHAAAEFLGRPAEEILGRDDTQLFDPGSAEAIMEGDRRVMAQDHVMTYEEEATVGGVTRTFLAVKGPFRDANGTVVGLLGVSRDITDRKEAEREIQRLNEELEQRVIQRTAQLQASMEEMEAFTYSVSHDLRAPLRAMDGFSLALLEDHRTELTQEGMLYLNRIRTASQRMGQLIDDLLQLSRVTRGELRRTKVDLSALARMVIGDLQVTQPERVVTVDVADGLVVEGDPRLLEQVLRNLLGNAWKFTGKHATARIEFGATQQEGEQVFYVRDDGAGFDMAYANKLFRIFQRLHGMEEFEGTGIGLVTVSRIIQRHGGRVWAEGAPEQGATFYFTLPHQPPSLS